MQMHWESETLDQDHGTGNTDLFLSANIRKQEGTQQDLEERRIWPDESSVCKQMDLNEAKLRSLI